jgi:hypothetical protein
MQFRWKKRGLKSTIVEDIPYDRAKATMSGFTMCGACRAEYSDPPARRFHAQPNACAVCEPSVCLVPSGSLPAFRMARKLLRERKIGFDLSESQGNESGTMGELCPMTCHRARKALAVARCHRRWLSSPPENPLPNSSMIEKQARFAPMASWRDTGIYSPTESRTATSLSAQVEIA